jgi:hypothetical protein
MGLTALAIVTNDAGGFGEVDLNLFTKPTFEAAKGKLARWHQPADKAPGGVIGAGEAVLSEQVLVDALGAQPEVALKLNHITLGLAATRPTAVASNSLWDERGQ